MQFKNEHGQTVGIEIPDWEPRDFPHVSEIAGQYCKLERINTVKHADSLYAAYKQAHNDSDWTYLSVAPLINDRATFDEYILKVEQLNESIHYAIVDPQTNKALGTIALMRINPLHGSLEVGFVIYSPTLKRTRIATEAQYLLMNYALGELRYRRYEWSCNNYNEASRKAALRLGFLFEGIFRNLMVCKNRSWDRAWFSITDEEWPLLKPAYDAWLSPSNFDKNAKQLVSLSTLIKACRNKIELINEYAY